jgi:hypothetical protein
MLVLSIIDKKDEEDEATDILYLSELAKMFESHLEYIISNLIDEGYLRPAGSKEEENEKSQSGADSQVTVTKVETERLPDLRFIQDYKVTQKGKAILQKRQEQLKQLVVTMLKLYEAKNIEELYNYLFANKDWIPLMLHIKILNMNNFKSILSLLGIDLQRLKEDELQKNLNDLGIDPGLLTAGLIFISPLAALIVYIISKVVMNKLGEKYEDKSQDRYAKYRIE